MKLLHVRFVGLTALVVGLGGVSPMSSATLVSNTFFSSIQTAFAGNVSSSDLVNTGSLYLSSVVFSGYTPWVGFPPPASSGPAINNGAFGAVNNPSDVILELPMNGYSVTFNLDLSSGRPYVITGITTIAGWGDWARNRQFYELQYSVVGNPGFVSLGSFFAGVPAMDGSEQTSKRTFSDTTGVIASNVDAIRFVMNDTYGDTYREIDIFGAQIPEPSTMFLLSVGGFLIWRRARK